jgi:hypothetical protein
MMFASQHAGRDVIPSARKKKRPVTPCVPARLDRHYVVQFPIWAPIHGNILSSEIPHRAVGHRESPHAPRRHEKPHNTIIARVIMYHELAIEPCDRKRYFRLVLLQLTCDTVANVIVCSFTTIQYSIVVLHRQQERHVKARL